MYRKDIKGLFVEKCFTLNNFFAFRQKLNLRLFAMRLYDYRFIE